MAIELTLKEDTHPHSPLARAVRKTLYRWKSQRDYPLGDYAGLEYVLHKIAKFSRAATVEAHDGWWEVTIPDTEGVVSVRGCVLQHDKVWELSTVVYSHEGSVPEDDSSSHWGTVFDWTRKIASETFGDRDLSSIEERAKASDVATKVANTLASKVVAPAFQRTFDKTVTIPRICVGASLAGIPKGKIAWYDDPGPTHDYGIITIDPVALKDPEYMLEVLKHELLHAALATADVNGHGEAFKRLASAVGLPQKYQD